MSPCAGTATQSSTAYEGHAQAGRSTAARIPHFATGRSISHTAFNDNPWWEVDLGEPTRVDRVALWNEGAHPYRLANSLHVAARCRIASRFGSRRSFLAESDHHADGGRRLDAAIRSGRLPTASERISRRAMRSKTTIRKSTAGRPIRRRRVRRRSCSAWRSRSSRTAPNQLRDRRRSAGTNRRSQGANARAFSHAGDRRSARRRQVGAAGDSRHRASAGRQANAGANGAAHQVFPLAAAGAEAARGAARGHRAAAHRRIQAG